MKKLDNNQTGGRPKGHNKEHHRRRDNGQDRRGDKIKDRRRLRHHQQRHEHQPQQEQEDEPVQQRGVINTIAGGFSHRGLSNQSRKCHLHAIKDLDVNCVDVKPLRSLPPITFTNKDFKAINPINQDDLMVVSIVIANFMVAKVLIDQGSSIDIPYWKTFWRLEISPTTIQPHYEPLLDSAGKIVETRGYVDLMTTFG